MFGANAGYPTYKPRLKVYCNSTKTLVYDPHGLSASSYGHWPLLKDFGNALLFNTYNYSPTTTRHVRDLDNLLNNHNKQAREHGFNGIAKPILEIDTSLKMSDHAFLTRYYHSLQEKLTDAKVMESVGKGGQVEYYTIKLHQFIRHFATHPDVVGKELDMGAMYDEYLARYNNQQAEKKAKTKRLKGEKYYSFKFYLYSPERGTALDKDLDKIDTYTNHMMSIEKSLLNKLRKTVEFLNMRGTITEVTSIDKPLPNRVTLAQLPSVAHTFAREEVNNALAS